MWPAAVSQCSHDFCRTAILLALLMTVASTLRTCQEENFFRLQIECRDQNKRFTDAEKESTHEGQGSDSEICKALFEMWRCVARNIPECFLNTTSAYASYTHSPNNCKPSSELLLELQTLVIRGGSTVASTVVMEKTMLTTTQEPRSTSEEGEDDAEVEDEDNEDDNEKGNSSSQTTNGSSISRCSSLWLFFTAWLSAREIVRVTFRS